MTLNTSLPPRLGAQIFYHTQPIGHLGVGLGLESESLGGRHSQGHGPEGVFRFPHLTRVDPRDYVDEDGNSEIREITTGPIGSGVVVIFESEKVRKNEHSLLH